MKKSTFYLLTDTHYVSPQIWVEGDPINNRERGDQIALKATPEILDAFFEKILQDDDADTVVFTGDNVNNGDRISHEEFRDRLTRLTDAGKHVYVLSATHDYCGAGDDENTFTACRYTETGTEPIPFLRKSELFDFYYDFGPKQAMRVHRESGSYIVRLCEGVRLVMIDDNGNGRSHCGLFADGMAWLKHELTDAKEAGEYVLLAVHHPVLPPWEVFRHMADYELYGGYRELYALMCEENVRVVFTGHTHVQNIRRYVDDQGRFFYDVSTIAIANAAGKMRRVAVDADAASCDIQSVGIEQLAGETEGISSFDRLYPLNFPGIVEKMIPIGAADADGFLSLAGSILPVDKLAGHKRIISPVCRKAQKIKLSSLARFAGVWKTLSPAQRDTAKQTYLIDFLYTVLRHIYTGNAPYSPDTVENAVCTALAKKADRIVQRFHIEAIQKLIPPGSSLCEMAQDFLYNNRTGDDDAICIELA